MKINEISDYLSNYELFRKADIFFLKRMIFLHTYIIKYFNINNTADSRLIRQGAAPYGPFPRFVCGLRPFSTLYMCPEALSVRISESVCVFVSKTPKRVFNAGTKSTKNHEKIHRRLCDHFRRIRFIIRGGNN